MLEPIFSNIEPSVNEPSKQVTKPEPVKAEAVSALKAERKAPIKKLKSKFSGPSVKDALNGALSGKNEISAKEQHALYNNTTETEDFTQEQLNDKWKEFLDSKSDRPILVATLSDIPEINEDYSLTVVIENSVQEDTIRAIKPEICFLAQKRIEKLKN